MKKQKLYTEDVLFNNYMISSTYENYIHSQIPFYISSECYDKITYYSEAINKIAMRVLSELNTKHKRLISYVDDFPFKEEIMNLKAPVAPMLWTRYDTFRNDKGEVFFAEFNYDKPCAQKEIALAGASDFKGNINSRFKEEFINNLTDICSEITDKSIVKVGVLIDPCHYEEFHLATYFKDILKNTKIKIHQVGPKNLSVISNEVYAFQEIKLDIILRLYPTEFLYEVDNFKEILEVAEGGRVAIINDPRVVAIQAKAFFAYLWELVLSDSNLLSNKEKEDIRNVIPYTTLLDKSNGERLQIQINELIINKDRYVVKSSLGRYSGEVYIGKLYSDEEWKNKVYEVIASDKLHIIQDVINIKEEYTYRPYDYNMNIPQLAYANFGSYITKDRFIGACIRWSGTFLTDDSDSWMCPLGVMDYPIKIDKLYKEERRKLWDKVVERALFEYDFTGPYTNIEEYLSTDRFVITEALHNEMKVVSESFCNILKKTNKIILDNIETFSKLLALPDNMLQAIVTSDTEVLCAIGRIDFVVDNYGKLKILEFNSETPAGLVESIGITKIVEEELNINYSNPNKLLRSEIRDNFNRILSNIKKNREVKNIAFVSTSYYEDLYNTSILKDILQEEKEYNLILGNIYDLEIVDNKAFLYGEQIDAMYRYFPLDWIALDEELKDLIPLINTEVSFINPTHTLITQSKAYFAILHEFIGKGLYSREEDEFIKSYIPYTCLEKNKKLSPDFLKKPYLEREGLGISMGYEEVVSDNENVVFQDRINISPIQLDKYSTLGCKTSMKFPVIGMYITDEKAVGVFTRIGDFVTDSNAVFLPSFVE